MHVRRNRLGADVGQAVKVLAIAIHHFMFAVNDIQEANWIRPRQKRPEACQTQAVFDHGSTSVIFIEKLAKEQRLRSYADACIRVGHKFRLRYFVSFHDPPIVVSASVHFRRHREDTSHRRLLVR